MEQKIVDKIAKEIAREELKERESVRIAAEKKKEIGLSASTIDLIKKITEDALAPLL